MVQRSRILPPLTKAELQIGDGRPADFKLNVVPWWSRAVLAIDPNRLHISPMLRLIASAVAEVDPADEADIVVRPPSEDHDHQLLMMTAAAPNPFVKQDLAAGGIDFLRQLQIGLFSESGEPGM